MSGMNPWLAEIYGTDGADDLEKTAQAHLLEKLAEENNLDLSQFSPEELQMLMREVMGDQAQQQIQAPAQPGQPNAQTAFAPAAQPPNGVSPAPQQQMQQQPQQGQQPQTPSGMMGYQMAPQGGGADMAAMQKEAQAKFEEADLLGRVMAHAYTQELEKIASSKTAGRFGEMAGRAAHAAKGKAEHLGGVAKAHTAHGSSSPVRKAMEHVHNHRGAYAAGAGGAAGFAAGRKSKEASVGGPAFQKLAEMHAADILSASGFDPSTGMDSYAAQQDPNPNANVMQNSPASQQQAGQDNVQYAPGTNNTGVAQTSEPGAEFSEALDNKALEMLANAGYDVNEILARLQFAQQNNPGQA